MNMADMPEYMFCGYFLLIPKLILVRRFYFHPLLNGRFGLKLLNHFLFAGLFELLSENCILCLISGFKVITLEIAQLGWKNNNRSL
jgi:hypothetical protein